MPQDVDIDYSPLSGEPKKSMADYEKIGQEFYALASKHEIARLGGLTDILCMLSENLYLAKKPLNIVAEKMAFAGRKP